MPEAIQLGKYYHRVCFQTEIHKMTVLPITSYFLGARGSVVVKALCCKPEGRGFKSR
jgi:hypothetical protein